jgi:hypothetical protein
VPLTFDFAAKRIKVSSPQTAIDIQSLLNEIREAEATALGIANAPIGAASGKEALSTGVTVGITLRLLSTWQIEWWPGTYTATIGGGNLVSDTGDAVANVVGGPQVEITLSAAATITNGSGGAAGLTPAQEALLTLIAERVGDLHLIHGLDAAAPLSVSSAVRSAGAIEQVITEAAGTVTVERV